MGSSSDELDDDEQLPPGCITRECFWTLLGKERKEYRDRLLASIGMTPRCFLLPSADSRQIMSLAGEKRKEGKKPLIKITYPEVADGETFRRNQDTHQRNLRVVKSIKNTRTMKN